MNLKSKSTRREVMTAGMATVAMAVVGAPVVATIAKAEPGQLAALIRRYWAEVDVFNNTDLPDKEANALAKATYEATLRQVIGVPARSADDALAAMDWITKQGAHSMIELGGGTFWGRVSSSLVNAVRDYIASTMKETAA